MNNRPSLTTNLDSKTFLKYYYLKTELIAFCRQNGLQATGGKSELTNRIAHFLNTGEKTYKSHTTRKAQNIREITLDALIEPNFICSEKHRAFYKSQIGPNFSFNVIFQKWLKNNTGKTYADSIKAYHQILKDRKKNKPSIGKQFEYNAYIRDFFTNTKDKNLADAIKCWQYKKNQTGHNRYEKEDLKILEK